MSAPASHSIEVGRLGAARVPGGAFLVAFAAVALGLGAARAATTSYVPLLLERATHRPGLVGLAMLSNAAAGFLVPLAVGAWADRHPGRAPLIAGGVVISVLGLVAVALGSASTFLVLTAAAATVYVGINVAQTAHRTLVPERFGDAARPRATSAQELGQLAGALLGTVAGGLLVLAAPGLLFVLVAVAVVLAAVPTLRLGAVRRDGAGPSPAPAEPRARVALGRALRRRGTRELLVAQALWVGAYVGLTPFFALYARDVLGLAPGAAGAVLAAFGLLTGAGMLAAGRVGPERVRPALALGAGLLGAGLALAAPGSSLAAVAAPLALAALGAGIVTTLGFAYYSRVIPAGEAGGYSGAYFAVRAIAAAVAVPGAGLVVELTGSYRALLGMGALALAAVAPVLLAERTARPRALRAPIRSVTAVLPVYRSERFAEVALRAAAHADRVVLVDDGAPPAIAERAGAVARERGYELVRHAENRGKGTALADGIAAALAATPEPDAVVVLDSDGQHPPELIPAFVAAAADADVVIGNRRGSGMPPLRRLANAAASAGISLWLHRRLPDSQNGMRLLRADVLRSVPFPAGRYEAETRHLKDLVRARTGIAWVDAPTVYEGEPSDFRPFADTLRVAREIVARRPPAPAGAMPGPGVLVSYAREWGPRLLAMLLLGVSVGAALPLVQPLDERLFVAINGRGDGPEWLYQALDPHTRNYVLLTLLVVGAGVVARRAWRHVAGGALAIVLAAFAADVLLELIQLTVDRPRPQEALGSQALASHGRDWSHIPSFPSGHLVVTAAMVATAATLFRALRLPLLAYLAAIAVTRISFGAHFPLDVAVGAVIGWEVGLFAAGLAAVAGLVPAHERRAPGVPVPALALPRERAR